MDSLTKRAQPDRSKINMHEAFEVKYWSHALGVSKEELQKAVDKVKKTGSQTALYDAVWQFTDEKLRSVPGVNLNARLIFTAPQGGVYRLVATSFEQAGTGPYTLRIRELKEGK